MCACANGISSQQTEYPCGQPETKCWEFNGPIVRREVVAFNVDDKYMDMDMYTVHVLYPRV